MKSIIFSFVGNQDPYSGKNKQEGSIVTLVRHLQQKNCSIMQINLLCTKDTKGGAELTKEWLDLELKIDSGKVNIFDVSPALSEDPINSLLAVQEAKKVLKSIEIKEDTILDFNASSGTPAMKATWAILQAAGYAPNSRIWQVRNPDKLQEGQELVFENNVNVIKDELDAQVIKNQVTNYNYTGALNTIKQTKFANTPIFKLLEYGRYRLAFDFDRAADALQKYPEIFNPIFHREIAELRQRQTIAILKDIYYKILIEQKNKEYAELLILVFAFQEKILRLAVKQKLLNTHLIDKKWKDIKAEFKEQITNFDGGKLFAYLDGYYLDSRTKLRVDRENPPNRILLQTILKYFCELYSDSDTAKFMELIDEIDNYCQERNDYVHEMEGVSELPNEGEQILKTIKKLLKLIDKPPEQNSFDILNSHISLLLDNILSSRTVA